MDGRRSLALTVLVVQLAACRSMGPLAPHEVASLDRGRWLTVDRVDTSSIELRDVVLDSVSLRGEGRDGQVHVIPVDVIHSARVQDTDVAILFAVVPVAAVGAWLAHGVRTAPSPPPSSSCPFVYVHDGRELVFQAEPYGGAIVPALARTEWTPLPDLRSVEGEYRVRIANELDETQYIDEAKLLVVDHPTGTLVAADPYGEIHVFRNGLAPRQALDGQGRDWTVALRETDRKVWMSRYEELDHAARRTLRDPLVLEFPKPAGARTVRLLVNGATSLWGAEVAREFLSLRGGSLSEWYRELDQSETALMELVDWFANEGLYVVPIEVETADGWEPRGALYGSGPLAYKSTAYALDVGDVHGETLRIRLPVPVHFWVFNSIMADYGDPPAVQAVEVETSTEWDARGRETRSLLSRSDDRTLVMSEIGDHSDLVFPVPDTVPGAERTVFLKIGGHYEIHMDAAGPPREAMLRRLLQEPGYTLRFAFERYMQGAAASRPGPER